MDNQPCQRETDEYRCTAKDVCYSGVDIHCLDGKRCPFLVIKAEQPPACPECGHQKHIGSCYHLETIENVPKECGCYISADQEQKHCNEECANCEGECLAPKEQPTPEMPLIEQDYSAGLLNDYGGGDVGWWQDYLRCEIGRCNDYWQDIIKQHNESLPAHDAAIRAQARREFADKIIKEVPDFRGREKFIAHIQAEGGIE